MARRSAYTLFEVILTTAVIAITATLTLPSLDGMYPAYRVNAAVDTVRAAWAQGRAHAIEEGRPYRFAVSPGGDNYRLGPDDQSLQTGAAAGGGGRGDFVLEDHLPPGVTFALGHDGGQASQDGLSTVAVFLPDGTARDDAEVRFEVKGALPKTVKLRALTGAVTVQQGGGGAP